MKTLAKLWAWLKGLFHKPEPPVEAIIKDNTITGLKPGQAIEVTMPPVRGSARARRLCKAHRQRMHY